jgi:hypothetical protein
VPWWNFSNRAIVEQDHDCSSEMFKSRDMLYLYNNQHNALIHYFILRFSLTCFRLSYSPSSKGYAYDVENGDYVLECRLWARMERNLRSILAHRQSTFKEIITVCHIVDVASWWWAV